MVTTRMTGNRLHLEWIGLWLAGVLCGVVLMVAIGTFHHSGQSGAVTVSGQSNTQAVDVEKGGSAANSTGNSGEFLPGETRVDGQLLPSSLGDDAYRLPRTDEETYYRNLAVRDQGTGALPFDVANKLQPK